MTVRRSEPRSAHLPWSRDGQDNQISVAVVGDIMLDEYLEGKVSRISPEAPVPVHQVRNVHLTAGGAGNVARNIKFAGGLPRLMGVVGGDDAGQTLRRILARDGVDTDGIEIRPGHVTVKKTRVSAAHQQLVRIDWERIESIDEATQSKILQEFRSHPSNCLLVSDYGKGGLPASFVERLIQVSQEKSIPVIVDPKGRDYRKYAQCFLISPNYQEACLALGRDPAEDWRPEDLASELQQRFDLRNVLVTLGAKGMFLLGETTLGSGAPTAHYLPANAREVFDVSGAGDTVVGILSLALGAGCSLIEAMEWANAAAGIVVEKWGTQAVTAKELMAIARKGTGSEAFSSEGKATTLEAVVGKHGQGPRSKGRVVFTNGCFDILHAGHVDYLEKARSMGDVLVVGINSDASIGRLKGAGRPILPLQHRMRTLAALSCVDYVVSFDEDTPSALIEQLVPDILVKGADWQPSQIAGAEAVVRSGGIVDTIPLVDGLSTTEIINSIRSAPDPR